MFQAPLLGYLANVVIGGVALKFSVKSFNSSKQFLNSQETIIRNKARRGGCAVEPDLWYQILKYSTLALKTAITGSIVLNTLYCSTTGLAVLLGLNLISSVILYCSEKFLNFLYEGAEFCETSTSRGSAVVKKNYCHYSGVAWVGIFCFASLMPILFNNSIMGYFISNTVATKLLTDVEAISLATTTISIKQFAITGLTAAATTGIAFTYGAEHINLPSIPEMYSKFKNCVVNGAQSSTQRQAVDSNL
jgi:hypothetical protein